MPETREPSTAKDIAMRWSLWHETTVGRGTKVVGSTPVIQMPSSSSPAVTPSFASSVTITSIRLHSLTRWLAMPVMRVVPSATAASATAVMNASVIGSISTSIALSRLAPLGPVTVVRVFVCATSHPMSLHSNAKAASPWMLFEPTASHVTLPPVIAAKASGYVADDASHSTCTSRGLVYAPSGILYTVSPTRSTSTPNCAISFVVMSMYDCDTGFSLRTSSIGDCAYGADMRTDETNCDETLPDSSMRPPLSPVDETRMGSDVADSTCSIVQPQRASASVRSLIGRSFIRLSPTGGAEGGVGWVGRRVGRWVGACGPVSSVAFPSSLMRVAHVVRKRAAVPALPR